MFLIYLTFIEGFPKFYKNGYVRYCDEIRPIVCSENPGLDPVEITKLVASKWQSGLTQDEKKPYLDEAKLDKERFKRELKEFNTSHPDEVVEDSLKPKKKSKSSKPSSDSKPTLVSVQATAAATIAVEKIVKEDEIPKAFIGSNCELPIFTDAFLEHNKVIETELKLLRKNKIEFDLQNSVLMKHIENMENGVLKVDAEAAATKQRNDQLEIYLIKLKCVLASSFNSMNLQLPAMKTGASIENIGEYMAEITSPAAENIASKATEIVRKIDLKFNS